MDSPSRPAACAQCSHSTHEGYCGTTACPCWVAPAELGLYRKFEVTRTDGSSGSGRKHHDCRYFVLDLDHDDYADAALLAYADACESEYPALAADLRKHVEDERLMKGLYDAGWEW